MPSNDGGRSSGDCSDDGVARTYGPSPQRAAATTISMEIERRMVGAGWELDRKGYAT